LGYKCVYRSNLDASAPARISKRRCIDVVPAVRLQRGKGCKGFNDLLLGGRSGKTLKQFLEHQTCSHYDFISEKCFTEDPDLWNVQIPITPERQ